MLTLAGGYLEVTVSQQEVDVEIRLPALVFLFTRPRMQDSS